MNDVVRVSEDDNARLIYIMTNFDLDMIWNWHGRDSVQEVG